MNRDELEIKLDEWLDRATAGYGAAEARPGFEARVIAGVNSRLAGRRLRFRWLSLATAATTILGLFCFVFLTRFEDRPAGETAMQKGQQPSLPPMAKQERPPLIVRPVSAAKRHAAKRAPIEAREVAKNPFLSAGLSDQERYLLSFVKTVSARNWAGEAESGPLQMPDFELSTIQIPKAQVSSIMNIDTVQLPATHPSEDQL